MSLIIASVHGEVPDQLHGADLLEIRVDGMQVDEAIERLPSMLKAASVPTIVTCRSAAEGGMFEGDEEERVSIYKTALDCDTPPQYIDVEYESLTRHPLLLDALQSEHAGIILSWHDFKSRPSDLLQRAAAMQDVAGVDVVKMVWRARSIRDNLEAFSLLQSRQQPMIAMCLGKYGLMSRVLAPKFGGFAVYASVDGCKPTASGQLTTNTLRSMYRFKEIDSQTKLYGVIGNNVAHSASPAFHNAAFEVANTNSVYLPMQIPPGWEHFKASVKELCGASSLHFSGASITIPHKENATKLATVEDGFCVAAGATNTLSMRNGEIFAHNTDVCALASLAPDAKQVLVLGAGGVARAAIVAMINNGASVFVAARNAEQV
ncbi:MAG TPA: type I 3-dehydroquinate dehydratase, partial [Phycisphaerales bacterium]|nr:type I 3-dehydroquinate dehydratase [Phycisphaerales bacterium]